MRLLNFLVCSTLAVGKAALAGELALKETDLYTLSCLNGIDYAEMRAYCSKRFPDLRDPIEKSVQDWRSRNAEAIKEIDDACTARIQKLESQDAARLNEVKKYAEQMSAIPMQNRPGYDEISFKSDCRALAREFADPQRGIISPSFAREIRTHGFE